MSQAPVLLLPAELQTEILGSLDPKTLKACMITCRQLHKLICDVSSLQYKITLPSTGMNDGPDRTLPAAAERLDRLRMHRDAWRELDWNEAAPWAIPSPYRVGISSGIFVAFFPEESKLILWRPPSSLRNVARLDWELKLPCVPYDICIDASQDLLAVVENLWGWGPVDPALTELPCVVSRRALPDTLDGNGGSVLLTEDAILYVPPADLAAGSGEMLEIRVFEF
ncbi:hypothetical protein OF83DRAFT_1170314 [Amylostereum chailletii]|nr:hypothetical protein OF83DRAFT_1170314 [Amylostereum chailletii]